MNELQTTTERGRIWALASYIGLFLWLPVGLIPVVLRENGFAVHHGRITTAVFAAALAAELVVGAISIPLGFCTLGLSYLVTAPIMVLIGLWPLVTGIHGAILAANEDWSEPIGGFGLAERLFSTRQIPDRGDE